MELNPITVRTKVINYMPLPRSILELRLPPSAVLLYGLLLDRASLSQKNHYTDAGGWLYVVYPILELGQQLHLSHTSVKTNLRILEREGLIRRLRRSRKEANQLYLCIPADAMTETGKADFPSSGSQKTVPGRERKVSPINRKYQQDAINQYQGSEEESL